MADRDHHTTEERNVLRLGIEAKARQLGFHGAGIAPAVRAEGAPDIARYRAWLEAGYHGDMGYLARDEAVARRADLTRILPGVQSVVVAVLSYDSGRLPVSVRDDPARGIIARYAWRGDYHDRMLPRLQELASHIEVELARPVPARAYVDTGPLLERALAIRAGLGFVGKNTNLIHPRLGSWLFLGELLLVADLAVPHPEVQGTCGRCTRCLEACPTGALVAPYMLDARRCISYLTIELRGPIPRGLRPLMGNRIFGCDICQEVCPWNRRLARPTAGSPTTLQLAPDDIAPSLLALLDLDDEGFRRRFSGSPVMRAKRSGLLRNVAVALGNWAHPDAMPSLVRALEDTEPLIRGHVAWARGRVGTQEAGRALRRALVGEEDSQVHQEITAALSMLP